MVVFYALGGPSAFDLYHICLCGFCISLYTRFCVACSFAVNMISVRYSVDPSLMCIFSKRFCKEVRKFVLSLGVDNRNQLPRGSVTYSMVPNVDVFGSIVRCRGFNKGTSTLIINMLRDWSFLMLRLSPKNFC